MSVFWVLSLWYILDISLPFVDLHIITSLSRSWHGLWCGKCGMRGFSGQGRAEISSSWRWWYEMKWVLLTVMYHFAGKISVRAGVQHQWGWLIDRQRNCFVLKPVSGERTWQGNLSHKLNLSMLCVITITQSIWTLLHTLEPSQGYSGHSSLKHIAVFSPALVSFSHLSFLACSQSGLAPPAIWSDHVPFAVGYQDSLGPQKQRGGLCMQKWQTPSCNKEARWAWPQCLKSGLSSIWEPLACRLSRRTGISMENISMENRRLLSL